MAQIPPIEDGYIDGVIKSNVPYNPTLNQTQGVKLRELVKLLRDRLEQEIAENHQIFTAALEAKVDKEAGKGLSQENFTLAFKNKLEELALMGIPAGPVDTIGTPVSENSPKLFYNTTSRKLRIYDPVSMTWRDSIEADLSNYLYKGYNNLQGVPEIELEYDGGIKTRFTSEGIRFSDNNGNEHLSLRYNGLKINNIWDNSFFNLRLPTNGINSAESIIKTPHTGGQERVLVTSVNNIYATENGNITIPIEVGNLQSVTTGTGNNKTNNAIHVTGLNNLDETAVGLALIYDGASSEAGIARTNGAGGVSSLVNFTTTDIYFDLAVRDVFRLRPQTGVNAGALFSTRVGGSNGVNATDFITKSQLDAVQNNAVTLNTVQTITAKKTFQTPNAATGDALSPLEVTGGNGSNTSETGSFNIAGNAAHITIRTGNGGNSIGLATSGTNAGGNGGDVTILAGNGGFATGAGTNFGGTPGNAILQAGSALGSAVGGNAEVKAGNNDTGTGGSIFLASGYGSGGRTSDIDSGHIYIGMANNGTARGNVIIGGINSNSNANLISNGKRLEVRGTGSFTGTVVGADAVEDNEFVTKSQLDSQTLMEALNQGSGIGYRIKGSPAANYSNIGLGSVDFSASSEATGLNGASKNYSTAFGLNNRLTTSYSLVSGNNNKQTYTGDTGPAVILGTGNSTTSTKHAVIGVNNIVGISNSATFSNKWSTLIGSGNKMNDEAPSSSYDITLIGENNTALGASKGIAIGGGNTIKGQNAVAIGDGTHAEGGVSIGRSTRAYATNLVTGVNSIGYNHYATVLGVNNDPILTEPTLGNPANNYPLLVVGNGISPIVPINTKSNAYVLYFDGSSKQKKDVEIETIGSGVIMKSPDGSRWRITVANDGSLTTTKI